MLVSMDGRAHVRQRRLISAGFTPRMVGRLETQTREWAVSIVERARERGTWRVRPRRRVSAPDAHDRRHRRDTGRRTASGSSASPNRYCKARDPNHSESGKEFVLLQMQMFEYAQELGRRKRSEPQDDVWTVLSTVEVETDDGERTALGETELDMFFFMLTFAGSETTRNAISGGLIALLEHPDQLAMLRRDPEAMRPAVEEILRWTSPVAYFARRAHPRHRDPGRADRGGRPRHAVVPLGQPGRRRVRRPVLASTSPARRTTTWPSAAADRTTASERTSPAGRSRSCSRSSSRAPPTSRSSRLPPTAASPSTTPCSGRSASFPSACPDGTQASEVRGDANHVVASVATATTEELPGSRRGDGGKTGPCV